MHWIQNKNVNFYPTHIQRQLYQPPFAEYVIAHLQILSGSDRFANMVQWLSIVASIVGVSAIAQLLGAQRIGQILAGFYAATIPMGVLQGSSTQNDYVVTFWLICFVFFSLSYVKKKRWINLFGIGSSLGLAILTKGTSYIYAFPFSVWLFIKLLKKDGTAIFKTYLFIIIFALLINMNHYYRNFELFGRPIASGSEKYLNEEINIRSIISNVSRNVALHLITPFQSFNFKLEEGIKNLHKFLGVSINYQPTTLAGKYYLFGYVMDEDYTGNLVHLILIIISVGILFIKKKRKHVKLIIEYGLLLVGGFLLFSLLLKAQPFHSRLHLPLFILWSAAVATVITESMSPKMIGLIFVILFLSARASLIHNRTRPLVGDESVLKTERTSQYFNKRPELKRDYEKAVKSLIDGDCSKIGLYSYEDSWEYPFWVLLQDNQWSARIEHFNVENISSKKYAEPPFNKFDPCAVIAYLVAFEDTKSITETNSYFLDFSSGLIYVFVKR